MSTIKSVAKSAGIISLATFASRILGFIRDILIARLFGIYIYAQAFAIAFKIPNLLRDLLGEGAASAAFVPVFSEYAARKNKEDFWELANIVLNILLMVLMLLVLLGILFAPLIVRLIAPGFTAFPEQLAATIKLTRLVFPYILLISLAAYSMAILNSLRHFAVPAFAPCLLNISIIAFVLFFGEGIKGLASGVLVGGFLQLAVQLPVLYKKGFRFRIPRSLKHPQVKIIMKLLLPRFLSSAIYHLNNFADTIFGSLFWIVGEGGVAVLYFAYRLILFPLGIFSNALSQAILPTLTTQALDEKERIAHTLSWGLRTTFFLMLPASAGFIVLSHPIISTLFEGGRFSAQSTLLTAHTLIFYSIGLFAYAASRVLQSCYFALKDTLTPAKVAALALVINIILNSILMFPLKISGLALATSISGINSFFILLILLRKKIAGLDMGEIRDSFLRIFAASIFMGAVCYFSAQKIFVLPASKLSQYINLFGLILIGFIAYAFACFVFRVEEMRQLLRWLRTKYGRSE